uniref:Uncharacterized protein n=1 Tax=Arundo donax TaxID=35708 RepID=A0A0A9ANG4_ARUDO
MQAILLRKVERTRCEAVPQ